MTVRPIDANIAMKKIREYMEDFPNASTRLATCRSILSMLGDENQIPTLTPPNEWVSVYDRLPEPGERVLATDCGFVGEFYINKRGKWQRYNVNCSELLMALDILYWMPLPAPPDRRPPEGEEDT